ncbi:MAG TPA: hypothetical protein VG894_06475 [Bauldia sp.]|nr:hypothetical protein [Bauldia sp.]
MHGRRGLIGGWTGEMLVMKSTLVKRLGATALVALLTGNAAGAITLNLGCTTKDGPKDIPFTVSYTGDANGMLTVKSADGEMDLKARYVEQDANNWGIDGFGPATVIMPDKTALEACLKAKAQPGDLDSADAVAFLVVECENAVAPGAAPVSITADVQISYTDGDFEVFLMRKYADTSPVAGGHIELSSVPPPACAKQ